MIHEAPAGYSWQYLGVMIRTKCSGISYMLSCSLRQRMLKYLAVLLLFATLPVGARASNDHWFVVHSTHFTVLTDASDKQARRIADQFERMRAVFHTLMPASSDAVSPITVLAFKDKKGFQSLEPASYLARGQLDLAGLFLRTQDKNYILLRLDGQGEHPFATVYHEYTHFMTTRDSEWIPIWMNEGLAEFYQNTDIREKDVLIGQPSAEDILYLRQNTMIPLTTLFRVNATSPYYHEETKGSIFYAESWALTHYLIVTDHDQKTHRLRDYADLLIKKQDPVTAAQQAFGDLKTLQTALSNYVARSAFYEFKMNSVIAADAQPLPVMPISSTDVDAVRADVLLNDDRHKEARTLLETVLRDDPKNALAHEAMGSLNFRDGNIELARKWYGEAVQLDSQSYMAHYYYAVMTMQSGDTGHDAEIEASLRKSTELNPAFAPAYDRLAMFYGMRNKNLTEAHMLNIKAIELEPDSLNYRMNAASVLMQQEQFDGAASVLRAAEKVAKTPEETASLQSRIQQIEQYRADVERSQKQQASVAATSQGTVVDTRTNTITRADGRQYVIAPAAKSNGPQYPTESPTGPHHTARGVLRSVQCSYPKVLTLQVDQAGKEVALYQNDFYQIEFSAANFTPKSDINPCTDIEGLKAKVEYAEVSDKSIAGQIISIELSK